MAYSSSCIVTCPDPLSYQRAAVGLWEEGDEVGSATLLLSQQKAPQLLGQWALASADSKSRPGAQASCSTGITNCQDADYPG